MNSEVILYMLERVLNRLQQLPPEEVKETSKPIPESLALEIEAVKCAMNLIEKSIIAKRTIINYDDV
jgi:hypothetical protein